MGGAAVLPPRREPSGDELVEPRLVPKGFRTPDEIDVDLLHRLRPHDMGVARGDKRQLPRFVDELLDERSTAKRIADETARGQAADQEAQ